MTLTLEIRAEFCPLREPFELARGTLSGIDVIVVELIDANGRRGRGEAPGLPYEGESSKSMTEQLREVAASLRVDMSGEEVLELMPRKRRGLSAPHSSRDTHAHYQNQGG